MANANLTMGVNGVDKTGAAFSSVKNRARATGASIRAMFASAFAAAGVYMGARSWFLPSTSSAGFPTSRRRRARTSTNSRSRRPRSACSG